jgi:hypothetical protein
MSRSENGQKSINCAPTWVAHRSLKIMGLIRSEPCTGNMHAIVNHVCPQGGRETRVFKEKVRIVTKVVLKQLSLAVGLIARMLFGQGWMGSG